MATSSMLRGASLDIRLNGAPLPSAYFAEIRGNNHLACDRFTIRAAIPRSAIPTFVNQPDILADLRISLNDAASVSIIQGNIDHIDFDAVTGTIGMTGRDLSASLIEARTRESFANQMSSGIATLFAGRHGLSANVQATATPVGRYWELEHDHITLDQFSRSRSEWDLLVALAGHEEFDVWVSGTTLNFRPAAASPPAMTLRAVSTRRGPPNVASLRLERALTFARDIVVTVKSWNSRQHTAFEQTARSSARGGGQYSAKTMTYVYVVPNLTADDAQKLARRKLAELSSHERVVIAEMPGELSLHPRGMVAVEGTESDFDTTYTIDEVERRFDLHGGFTQKGPGTHMERFLNALKAQSASLDGAQAQPRFAIVASVDPVRYAARVKLQPEGVLTGWLPILAPWVGAGWGLSCPPAPGDQVLVVAQEGHADHGVILGGSWSDGAQTPGAPVGEIWLVHASGASIKLLNDGAAHIQGDLHVSGDVFDHHGSLDQLRQHYNQHGHPNASPPPNPVD